MKTLVCECSHNAEQSDKEVCRFARVYSVTLWRHLQLSQLSFIPTVLRCMYMYNMEQLKEIL